MNETTIHDALPPDDAHDELVAYLDGEVSADDRERIEKRLSDDESYRTQFVQLERSWRMLDRLPTAEQDQNFTKTTIAMVTAEINDPNSATADGGSGRSIPWGKILGVLAACFIGYFAVMLPSQIREEKELKDLPVAQNLELYRYAESVELLRLMRDGKTFNATSTSTDHDKSSDTEGSRVDWSQSNDPATIQAVVEELNASEKDELAKLRTRFELLSADEQNRMRTMHRQLADDPQSDELFTVLRSYREWLATLSAAQRADLLDVKEPDARVAEIAKIQRAQAIALVGPDATDLTMGDKEAVLAFVKAYLKEHTNSILDQLPEHMQRRARGSRPSPFRDVMLWTIAFSSGKRFGMDADIDVPPPSDELTEQLEKSLSPVAKRKWQEAGEFNKRKNLLEKWIKISLQSIRYAVSPEELESYYIESLTSAQRDELKQLPPEEMRETLRRWFLQSRSGSGGPRGPGFRGPDGPPHFGPRGDGGRGDRHDGGRGREREDGPRRPPRE